MLTAEQTLTELARYESEIEGILSRFTRNRDGIHIKLDDQARLQLIVHELFDLLRDALGRNNYSLQIRNQYNSGVTNFYGSSSYSSVESILMTVRAAKTRITRNPAIIQTKIELDRRRLENIFLIHGRDEAKRRKLKEIIKSEFKLNVIVLSDEPDHGCKTVIEKFEHYAPTCSYAIALFTPDDEVKADGETYLQARPNVIYEIGWFCGALGRSSVMLLLKEGTEMFSDFGGIIQKRFVRNASEKTSEIRQELVAAKIIAD